MTYPLFSILIASFFGFSGLILDAIGSHALTKWLAENAMLETIINSWKTAVKIQLFHALLLLVLVPLQNPIGKIFQNAATGFAVFGVILFCGSIYSKTLFANPSFGKFAPFGGILLMFAWISIAVGALFTHFRGP